jgi:hypothetical protein
MFGGATEVALMLTFRNKPGTALLTPYPKPSIGKIHIMYKIMFDEFVASFKIGQFFTNIEHNISQSYMLTACVRKQL